MMAKLEQQIATFLRVPTSPNPPQGASESLQVFRASKKYYWYKLCLWVVKQISGLIALSYFLGIERVVSTYFTTQFGLDNFVFTGQGFIEIFIRNAEIPISFISLDKLFYWLAIAGLVGYLIQLPYTFLLLSLDYKQRWYMLTDTSLRIREGVVNIREQTMTFKNIQNLSIKQGPVQGLLGISDLLVQTAGGGGSGDDLEENSQDQKSLHTGYFRGVDNAEQIRDLILGRLTKGQMTTSLDLEKSEVDQSLLIEAANAIRDETRLMHKALINSRSSDTTS